MDRRDFIKTAGAGTAALGLAACGIRDNEPKSDSTSGEMPSHMDGISLLGFGCMRWPTIEMEDGSREIDQEAVDKMVDRAIEAGVNYFDSAPVYVMGKSEAATAKALLRHPRESYLIATKCSNHRGDVFPAQQGIDMYKHSLELYQTDHIDYYLLHCITSFDNFQARFIDNGLLDFFLKEREEGRIRKLGWSYHGDRDGFDAILALNEKYHWDFVQIQMNYMDWKYPNGEVDAEHMYTELDRMGIPVVIMEPLLGGQLADVPSAVLKMMKERDPQASAASWAFRFCGSHPRILTTLSGMTCMEHLEDNLKTFLNFKPLSEEEFDMLAQAALMIKNFPLVPCTSCQYCMPCPYGINIPGIFSFYNKRITEGSYAVSKQQEGYEKIRRRYLLDYDKAIPTVRQADHCIGCMKCKPRCPQKIDIPTQLRNIDRYIETLKREK